MHQVNASSSEGINHLKHLIAYQKTISIRLNKLEDTLERLNSIFATGEDLDGISKNINQLRQVAEDRKLELMEEQVNAR